jgi:CRP-like cAMP-binding protein
MEVVGGSGGRNYFGELSLLYDAPRAATVTAVRDIPMIHIYLISPLD